MAFYSDCVGFQQISSLAASTGLTVPATARFCWVQCENANVRFRLDGTAPTASVGQILYDGDPPLSLENAAAMAAARFIAAGGSPKLNVHYFGTRET